VKRARSSAVVSIVLACCLHSSAIAAYNYGAASTYVDIYVEVFYIGTLLLVPTVCLIALLDAAWRWRRGRKLGWVVGIVAALTLLNIAGLTLILVILANRDISLMALFLVYLVLAGVIIAWRAVAVGNVARDA
jgi:hypothetical protein